MYNFIVPCRPSHVIVPKYCHVGASLKEIKTFFQNKINKVQREKLEDGTVFVRIAISYP